jgi:hypothetical protein
MENRVKIERCGLANGEKLCVLKKGHNGPHCFKEVPILNDPSLFSKKEPLYDAFCPFCGSRPMLEGPGCKECSEEDSS